MENKQARLNEIKFDILGKKLIEFKLELNLKKIQLKYTKEEIDKANIALETAPEKDKAALSQQIARAVSAYQGAETEIKFIEEVVVDMEKELEAL